MSFLKHTTVALAGTAIVFGATFAEAGQKKTYKKRSGTHVSAPYTKVDVDDTVRVKAPYTKVKVGKRRVKVRAPYVNLNITW